MKLKVKDSKGRVFQVSDACIAKDAEEKEDELSAADIKKLKRLIPHMDDLLQLLELEEQEHDKDFASDEIDSDEEIEKKDEEEEIKTEEVEDDSDIEVEEDEEAEELTQNVKPVHDSKKSFGAIERRKVTDSVNMEIEQDNDIALAWAKRYGGN